MISQRTIVSTATKRFFQSSSTMRLLTSSASVFPSSSMSLYYHPSSESSSSIHSTIPSPFPFLKLNSFKQFSTNIKNDNDIVTSTTIVEIKSEPGENTTTPTTPWVPKQFLRNRPESILKTTYSNTDYTIGQGWFTIQKHLAGGKKIRHEDFATLCSKTQSKSIQDANLLITMCKELRRCNEFILSKDLAKDVVNGMYKALTADSGDLNDSSGYYKTKCGLKIGEAFVNTKTGLYVSLETPLVQDKILIPLYNGLLDIQEHLESRKKTRSSEEAEKWNEMYRIKSKTLFDSSVLLSNDIFTTLLTRACNPTRNMKKRAKRKYLRYSRCCDGPTPDVIDYLVRICLLQTRFEKQFGSSITADDGDGSSNESSKNESDGGEIKVNDGIRTAKSILDTFAEKEFLGKSMEQTYALVAEAEEMFRMPLPVVEDVETDAIDDSGADKSETTSTNEDSSNHDGDQSDLDQKDDEKKNN